MWARSCGREPWRTSAPTIFDKLARSLTSPYADLCVPQPASHAVDYEGELGVVIGKAGRDIPADRAAEHVAGYTVVNDISMRDFQMRSMQWFAGKAWQECTPVGPAVVTADEVGELGERELVVTVNGETRQRAWIGDLLFGVPALISDLSRIVEPRPGDVVATGTPGGVAAGMKPPRYLADGDVVEVRIDRVGRIRNTVRFR